MVLHQGDMVGSGPSIACDRVIPLRVNGKDVGPIYFDLADRELAEWYAKAEGKQAEILALAKELKEKALALGERLHIFIEARDYYPLGFDTAREWMISIRDELGFGPRWGFILKLIYKTYVEELAVNRDALASFDINKLAIIAPVVTSDNKDEWLDKAKVNTRSELRRMVRAVKALPPNSELFWDADSRRLVYLDGAEGLLMHGRIEWDNPGLSEEHFQAWVEDAEGHLGRLR